MSTKHTHTPGPWVVEDLGANCLTIKATGGVRVEPDAKAETRDYYQRIGSVTQRDPHPSLAGGIPRAVTEANARLIASAPDMLEALREVVRVFESNPSSICDTVWVTGNRPETLYDCARAAIAKATGQSPA